LAKEITTKENQRISEQEIKTRCGYFYQPITFFIEMILLRIITCRIKTGCTKEFLIYRVHNKIEEYEITENSILQIIL